MLLANRRPIVWLWKRGLLVWFINWLIVCFSNSLIVYFSNSLIVCLIHWLVHCLNDHLNNTKIWHDWYVQNVSIFSNPFAIVFSLICVFWIQLTRTNVVFSRIALVSRFCAEIRLSVKNSKNIVKFLFYQKTHGARIRDGDEPGGAPTTWWHGPGQVIHLKRIYNFWCSMLVFTPFA
jgi:hypothetical protein